MKKLTLILTLLLSIVCLGSWADTQVIARMQDLVNAASENNATLSTNFKTTVEKGAVYKFAGGNFIKGITNDAIKNAYGNKYVTVAAWVYGQPSGCIFSYGGQSDGVKYKISGTTMQTTTKGKADYQTAADAKIAAGQWNLIAFTLAPDYSQTRYCVGNFGYFYTKGTGNGFNTPAEADQLFAIGSGNQGNGREEFTGYIANLTVITSDGWLTASDDVNTLIGEAPSDCYGKPQFGGTEWTWNATNNNFEAEGQTATTAPERLNGAGPVYIFNGVGTVSSTASGSTDTSDKGGIRVLGNGDNVTSTIGRWAGSVEVGTGATATINYSVDLKGTEAEEFATVWTDGDLIIGGNRSSFSMNDGGDQRWVIGENGTITTSFTSVNKGNKNWNLQIYVADEKPVAGATRETKALSRKVMTWGADLHEQINSCEAFYKDAEGNLTKLNASAISYDATGITINYEGIGNVFEQATVTRITDVSELTDGLYIIKDVVSNAAQEARRGYVNMSSNLALSVNTADRTKTAEEIVNGSSYSAEYIWRLAKVGDKWTVECADGSHYYWPALTGNGKINASKTAGEYVVTNHATGNGTLSFKSGNTFVNADPGNLSGWSNAHELELYRIGDVTDDPVTLTYQLANGDVVATPVVNIPSCKEITDLTINNNVPEGYNKISVEGTTITVKGRPLKNGQTYYIYNDNATPGDKADIKYYLTYNGTGVALSSTKDNNTAQMWTVIYNGDDYYFRNVESGKYFAWKSLSDNPYNYAVGESSQQQGFYTLKGASYVVIPNSGANFDQSSHPNYAKKTSGFSADFNFEACDPSDVYMSSAIDENTNWLRIANSRNGNFSIATKSGDAANSPLHSVSTDAGSESQLFAFVGDMENGFYIYNKVLGDNITLTASATSNGSAITWAEGANTKWYLVTTYLNASENAGYVLTTQKNGTTGMNMYGGNGNDIKFYNADDAGSTWKISAVDTDPTIIHYTVTGTKKYPNDANQYVGKLTISKGSFTSDSYVTEADNNKTFNAYLPKSSEAISFKNYNLHGWKFEVSQQDGEYTITYTADQETNYQYLAFDKSAQWYRIPAIVSAKNGDLVSIYDYRVCHNDVGFGEVDQHMRRSSDFGQTWTAEEKIADGDGVGNKFGTAFGDPALVADRESGKMTLITVSGKTVYTSATATNHNLVSVQFSDDNGATWSDPEDITSQFWGAASGMFADADTEGASTTFAYSGFFGSGKILQSRVTKVGDYYRIYAAMLCRGKNVQGAYVVYSDDMGHTWQLLGGDNKVKAASGSDEPKVEELPNGDIVLSCRKYNGRYFNIWKWSQLPEGEDKVGAGQWGTVVQSNQQTGGISVGGNSCNGEILYVKAKKADDTEAILMLQSLPSGNDRSGVEIWYKDITDPATYADVTTFASNWTRGLRVSPQSTEDGSFSAYSTMTVQQDGKIGFLYEEGPATYCIVYVPLTVEEITKDAYKSIEVAMPSEEYIAAVAAMKNAYAEKNVQLGDGSSWLDYIASDAAALEAAKTAAKPQMEKSAIELYNEPVSIETLQGLTDALNAVSILQKYKKGCYVRIKGYSNNYISLPTSGSNGKMSNAEDKTTVLYLAPTGEITSFATGLGLTSTSIAGSTNLNQFTVLNGAQGGKYYIKSNATGIGTYLYDNTANGTKVDRNTNPVTNGSYQTDWTIIEVETSEIANLSSEEVQNNSLAYGVAPMVEGDYIANIIEKTADGNVVKNLALTDKVDFDTPVEFTAVKAIYKRVTPEGEGWNTAVLPYAFEVPAGMTVLNNATKGANSISFDEVTAGSTVAANTPFLYRAASGEVITIEAADVDIAANVEALTSGDLCGTYTKIGQGDATGKLIMTQDGQGFKAASALASIPAFRAYLEGNGATSSNVYTITIGDDLTGVYDFNASNGINQKVDVYSVDGKIIRTQVDAITALQGLASGTYIVNGNKIKK